MMDEFLKSISNLTRANLLTGFWDGKRNEMRKDYEKNTGSHIFKIFKNGDSTFIQDFIKTEKESRKNCELRAVERKQIDQKFEEIIKEKFK